MKIALVGDVALNLIAPYFEKAGFEVYYPSGFGAWRQEVIDENSALNRFKPDFIFDVTSYEDILSKECENFYDERMRALANMPYSLDGIHALVDEAKFLALSKEKKILAVDADNTLWRGILSEDGRDNLRECKVFQTGIKKLREKGVILVLLTKNDWDDNFFSKSMTLKDSDFAIRKINWAPKAGNLLEACKELNLGLESVVFVDDNPFERAQMLSHLPDVTLAPWEGWSGNSTALDEAQLIRRLEKYFFFNIGKTKEDLLRTKDYSSPAKELAKNFKNVGDYLLSLELKVEPRLATTDDIPRLVQMAGKTNQFNATTIRRTQEEFEALLSDETKKIFVFSTRDKFTEQGLVCYIVVDLRLKVVTDFVMSCRAMGRTLEHFAWQYVINSLGYKPKIEFLESAKNAPFKEFLGKGCEGKTYYEESLFRAQ